MTRSLSERPDMLPAGIDPRALVGTMTACTEKLCGVLDAETRALSRSDFPAFFAMQEQKEETARSWHAALMEIAVLRQSDTSPGIPPIDPDLRARLEVLHTGMAETVKRNRAAIERSSKSLARLNDRIMTHARRLAEEKDRVSYSAAGRIRSSSKRALSMGLSESA